MIQAGLGLCMIGLGLIVIAFGIAFGILMIGFVIKLWQDMVW